MRKDALRGKLASAENVDEEAVGELAESESKSKAKAVHPDEVAEIGHCSTIGLEMDATNSGAIGKDKVCAATTQLGYSRTDLTEFDLEKYGETGAISEVMDFHTGLADMQSVVGSSTGKKAHDMISKQLHGLGVPLWSAKPPPGVQG